MIAIDKNFNMQFFHMIIQYIKSFILKKVYPRMQQQNESLKNFFQTLAKSLDRDPLEFQPFLQILQKNWFTKVSDLRGLTQADYEKMNIPFRVSSSIQNFFKETSAQKKTDLTVLQNLASQEELTQEQLYSLSGKKTVQENPYVVLNEICNTILIKFIRRCNGNNEPWITALETLSKIFGNIMKDTYQYKYRTLKKSNKKIQNNLLKHPQCIQFLQHSGFEETEDTFTLTSNLDLGKVYFMERYCDANLSAYKNGEENRKKNQQPFLQFQFEDLSQKFRSMNQGRDEQASERAVLLERLTLKQSQIQSSPLKNRNIKIYHKNKQSKVAKIREQVNIEEQFQKSDCELMGKYLEEYTSASKNMTKLKNQHQAELQTFVNEKSYQKAVIRIKLPNQHNVQADFRPMEPLQEVLNLMKDIFPKAELHLFTIPPKKVMGPAQLRQTLKDLDMVPMACFHLGIQGTANMKDYYKQFIIS